LRPVSQESCAFFDDHGLFDDEEVNIASSDGGKRIGAALGNSRAVILRNHGLLTVGTTVDTAVALFVLMERSSEVHVKVPAAKPISDGAARTARASFTDAAMWQVFGSLVRHYVPDPSVIEA
jgi:ribulose-5-phosphate 4-epimerase/fuculose-1-phosphate aldolase